MVNDLPKPQLEPHEYNENAIDGNENPGDEATGSEENDNVDSSGADDDDDDAEHSGEESYMAIVINQG